MSGYWYMNPTPPRPPRRPPSAGWAFVLAVLALCIIGSIFGDCG